MHLPSENIPGQQPFPNNRRLADPIGHNHSIQKTSQRTLQNNSKSIYYIQFHYSSRGSTNSMALQAQPNPWHSRLNRLGSTIFTYIKCSAKCRQPNLNSQTTTQFVLSIWITHICSFN